MKTRSIRFIPAPSSAFALAACASLVLSACGGGAASDSGSLAQSAAGTQLSAVATGATAVQLNAAVMSQDVGSQVAVPAFYTAPVLPPVPQDVISPANDAAATAAPATSMVAAELNGVATRRLTPVLLQAALAGTSTLAAAQASDTAAKPFASGSVVATYTPSQIRAAYGLPALPASYSGLTAAQLAQYGAGQTIYLVDAQNDPNVAAELAAFNAKFALPGCTTTSIAASASLPLAAAPTTGCTFSVVYATPSGTMTASAPAYDSGWATEITLDVQWAHATAPLARLILVEAQDASLSSLLGAVQAANALGKGVVSMSFGGAEGNWTASEDSNFAVAGMTYLAATGDNGAGVSWPSVSANVLAVGGTTLTYSGSGTRSEVAWSGTGGGTSAYTATPGYQNSSVPGMGVLAHRTVADVSFNADPSTGQYIVTIAPGSSSQTWLSIGGTSLATPQWAGLIAIANAERAVAAKTPLGLPHSVLYGQISTAPATYASAFADIIHGSDGSCATCSAKTGYDAVTGLGTPNAASLLSALSGAAPVVAAPVVTAASISGQVGTALSFTVSATAADALSYSLTGAPSGMTVNATTGVVSWPTPVAGSYAVTAVAKDTHTNLTGQAVYSVTITAPQAPSVSAASITGVAGAALNYVVTVTSPDPVTYTLTGAPSGMTISSSGALAWPHPVLGSYAVTVTARDGKTGLSGSGVITVHVVAATATGPVITAAPMVGSAGVALTSNIVISDPGVANLQIQISGVPLGMSFSANGLTLTANWAKPVSGTYSLQVEVLDSAGHSAQVTVPITIH